MNFNRGHHVLRAPDDGGDGGAAAAPAAAPAAAAPAEAPAAAPPPATPAPPPSSALGAGATPPAPTPPAAAPATAAPDPVWGVIPAKYRTTDAAGQPDLSASWGKVEAARAGLEQRLGAGDAPPKTAAEYKLEFPAAIAEALGEQGMKQLGESEAFKKFTENLHGLGLNQKQYAAVAAEMIERGMALRQANAGLDEKQAVAELQKDWADKATYDKNVQAAYAATKTFGEVDKLMAKYGNDPDFIRFAAKVGAELQPDTSANAGANPAGQGDRDEHRELAAWFARNDATAEGYQTKRERFNALSTKIYGDGPKATGSMSFGQIG